MSIIHRSLFSTHSTKFAQNPNQASYTNCMKVLKRVLLIYVANVNPYKIHPEQPLMTAGGSYQSFTNKNTYCSLSWLLYAIISDNLLLKSKNSAWFPVPPTQQLENMQQICHEIWNARLDPKNSLNPLLVRAWKQGNPIVIYKQN